MSLRRLGIISAVALSCVMLHGCAAVGPTEPSAAEPVGEVTSDEVSVDEPSTSLGEGDVREVAPSAMAAGDPSGYVLGNGDVIGIQVFDEPDLTLEARVGSSGVINYSYLGDLKVAGRTPLELERTIAQQLRDGYLVNPSVNITVVQYRPFFINGEVRSPGGYPYQPGLTLGRAIALAGGITDRASVRKMYVVQGSSEGGSDDPTKVGMNYRVAPGDVISINEGFF